MSILAPFLAFLLAGAFAAYHRLRLAWWAAITAAQVSLAGHLLLVAAAVLAWGVVARITRAVDGGPQGNAA